MQQHDGTWECNHCGALLNIPVDAKPFIVVKSVGGQLTMRTVNVGSKEVHACPIAAAMVRRV
jgi:hypothetical protein